MTPGINCILLIDDNMDDNFYHERVIRKAGIVSSVIVKQSALEALQYLRSAKEHASGRPDLILLDINMPKMNGWEFLDEYARLEKDLQKQTVIIMLSTSENPDDKTKALSYETVSGFKTKPLTQEMLKEIAGSYFSTPDRA